MKIFFYLMSSLFTLTCAAQVNNRSSFEITCSPAINTVLMNTQIGSSQPHSKVSVSAGVNYKMPLNNKNSFLIGADLGIMRYGHTLGNLVFDSDINPAVGVLHYSSIETHVSYYEIQIPILIEHTLQKDYFYRAGLEFEYDFGDKSNRTIYYGNGQVELLSPRHLGFNGSLAGQLGHRFLVNSTHELSASLMLKYSFKEFQLIERAHIVTLGMILAYGL